VGGVLLPFVAILVLPGGMVIGSLLALAGLWVYEDLWVKAGQSIPLS
jgi:cytochrome c biogenesis protein ResB